MIQAFSISDAHVYGDALPQMHRLRKKIFVDAQQYKVPTWDEMEYDAYDTPAAVYGIWRDDAGAARGVMRLNPTTRPYMIEDVWPDSVTSMPLPKSADIWEATRCGIDHDLPKQQRDRVGHELMLAYQELGLRLGARALVAVSEPWVWDRMCSRRGWLITMIGEAFEYDGWTLIPVMMPISRAILQRMRENTGIYESVLEASPLSARQMAL